MTPTETEILHAEDAQDTPVFDPRHLFRCPPAALPRLMSLNVRNKHEHTNDQLWAANFKRNLRERLAETEGAFSAILNGG